jgi:CheY-like chemotaxis protein
VTTILAVDDSATMRKCLEITFSGTEFELVTVESAESALEKVKTLSPSLVIADVSLPPHDGYELCSTIKLAAPHMPVLMLSSKQNPFDPTKGAQADGHVDKPFDTQVLQDKARELVVKSDHAAEADSPPAFGDANRGRPVVKPVAMPERAPSSKIPAPRRKRPTPAMMSKPETPSKPPVQPPQQQTPPPGGIAAAAGIRRTVPFAMPGAAKRTVPGGGLDRTIPMAAGREPVVGRGAITPPLGPAMGGPAMGGLTASTPQPPQAGPMGTTRPVATQQSFGLQSDLPPPPTAHPTTPHGPMNAHAQQAPTGHRDPGREPAGPTPVAGAASPGKPLLDMRPRTSVSDTLPGVSSPAEIDEPPPPTPALPQPTLAQPTPAQPTPAQPTPAQPTMAQPTPLAKSPPPPPAAPAVPEVELAPATAMDLQGKLEHLGLTKVQVEGVLALSRELIEQVVWEVVPVLAETLIKEEIRRLTKD